MNRKQFISPQHLFQVNGKQVLLILKPYSRKELAGFYGVCSRTMRAWLEPFKDEVGPLRGRYYTIHQVKVIFEKLDPPEILYLNAA